MCTAVGIGEQEHVFEIGMSLEPVPGPLTERAVAIAPGHGQHPHEPGRARRHEPLDRRKARRDRVGPVDRAAHVVHEGGREQFLVEWPLVVDEIEHLQRVLERIGLDMPRGIGANGGQRCHGGREPVEPIADERREAVPRVGDAMQFTPHFVVGRNLVGGHPPLPDPPRRPVAGPLGIAAPGQEAGGLLGDPAPQFVGLAGHVGRLGTGARHGDSAPGNGLQRRFRTWAVVA